MRAAGKVSAEERRQAQLIDRDRSQVERINATAARQLGFRLQREAVKIVRGGGDPMPTIREYLQRGAETLAEGMLAANLYGRRRSALSFNHGLALRSEPYDAAIKYLLTRMILDPEQVELIRAQYTAAAVLVLGRAAEAIEADLQRTILEAVRGGSHVREGVAALRETFARNGLAPDNSFTIEAIYRTQTQLAYSAGRYEADQDEAVQEILWGYKYVTVGDDRVRPEHVGLEGVTLPKDDPEWDAIWPPNGWACRCTTISIFEPRKVVAIPREVEVDGRPVAPGPDRGFNFHPGKVPGGPKPERV